jgi:hypothetical protein
VHLNWTNLKPKKSNLLVSKACRNMHYIYLIRKTECTQGIQFHSHFGGATQKLQIEALGVAVKESGANLLEFFKKLTASEVPVKERAFIEHYMI